MKLPTIDNIAFSLMGKRFNYDDEKQLQEGIAQVLRELKLEAVREHPLGKDRIDFYLPKERIGIEVKVGGSLSALTRQLHRYAASEQIGSILVVTTRSNHTRLPTKILKKDVGCVHLSGAFR